MIKNVDIEIVILAGGKSSRMGQDKGLMLLNGKPMITYVIDLVERLGLPLRIISNNDDYKKFGYAVTPDIISGKGPIGGLYTALETSCHNFVLLLSCDSPFIKENMIRVLISTACSGKITAPLFRNKLYPLCAIYPGSIKASVERKIKMNDLKMATLICENAHKKISMNALLTRTPEALININTPVEFKSSSKIKIDGN